MLNRCWLWKLRNLKWKKRPGKLRREDTWRILKLDVLEREVEGKQWESRIQVAKLI